MLTFDRYYNYLFIVLRSNQLDLRQNLEIDRESKCDFYTAYGRA